MASTQNESVKIEKPTVLITIGMAGSGKTTFMQVKYVFLLTLFSYYYRDSMLIYMQLIQILMSLIWIQLCSKFPSLQTLI